ncbi:MAG: hypothetical protein CVT48_00650 [Thermoplasmata archaeon HGW-Thermoplasmata-1]|nr:MAG: hypothetical protein CVT48_00650 [Thermoplasmata archaeon HGW-Thermoplasmata-1]
MKIIPVMHVLDGALVRYDDGGWAAVGESPLVDEKPTPRFIAPALFESYGEIYWVDVDGQKKNEPQLDIIKKLSPYNLWVDASPRTVEDAMDLFVAGASKITIRPSAMPASELSELFEFADGDIYIGLETMDGEPLFRNFTSIDFGYVNGVVAVDYGASGKARGISDAVLKRLMEGLRRYVSVPIYVAGGVRGADLARIESLGFEGAMVGTSIIERGERLGNRN